MLAVDAIGHEVLVYALGRTLPVVALVVAVTAVVMEPVLLALAMMTMMMVSVIALIVGPVALTLVRNMAYFTHILFFQFVA
jgi:hypothetical protein